MNNSLCHILMPLTVILVSWASAYAGESSGAKTIKAKYGPEATPLSISHSFLQKSPALDYWKLSPYYVGQQTDSACSLAVVTQIVNAVRSGHDLKSNDELVNQAGLLNKLWDASYTTAVAAGGDGINLEQMKSILERGLRAYGVAGFTVQAIHTPKNSSTADSEVHKKLIANENSADNFIVANFIQGVFTGDEMIGHFAAVGAYDQLNGKVLILDPDRRWYEPYWVKESTFVRGMMASDKAAPNGRGFLWIQVPKN